MKHLILLFSAATLLLGNGLNAQEIVHYWHFNEVSGTLDVVPADLSNTVEPASLVYQKIDDAGDDIGIMDDVGGSDINARMDMEAGNGIRPRNPSANGELFISMSTEGFENLHLSYASERSGSGMLEQELWYTTDGVEYQLIGDPITVATSYALVEVDLSDLEGVNNNPLFAIKMRFLGQNTADNGNNRLDNIVLEGDAFTEPSIIHYWHFNEADGQLGTVNADVFIGTEPSTITYQKIDEAGDDIGIMDDVGGTDINARLGFEGGNGIRPRNPSANGELQINMSTVGFENLHLSYATERSGSGMLEQELWYTTNGTDYQLIGAPITVATSYALVEVDLSDIEGVNDNPLFAMKMRFLGQNTADNGNNRIDNFVLEGVSLDGAVEGVVLVEDELTIAVGETAQLEATVLPSNASNQNVSWSSADESIATVDASGAVTGVASGSTTITVTTDDGGFEATASITVLAPFTVEFIISGSLGTIEGAVVTFDGEEQISDASGSASFERLGGTYSLNVMADGFVEYNQNIEVTGDETIQITLSEFSNTLIYYWHFNNLPIGTVESATSDYSYFAGSNPTITYEFLPDYVEEPGSVEGYMDDYTPGSTLNAQLDEPGGAALRVRNRSEGRTLLIPMPTTNCENIVLSFDVHRSGSGMQINHFEYTLDGETWSNDGLVPANIEINPEFETEVIDMTAVEGANDNPNFAVRIIFEGNTMQDNGNNRYDNIAVFANIILSSSDAEAAVSMMNVYPNPSAGQVTVEHKADNLTEISNYQVFDLAGRMVKSGQIAGQRNALELSNLQGGAYILVVQNGDRFMQQVIVINK